MTILVTGGAGYIGGHMVLALLDRGQNVIVLDDLSSGHAWAIPERAKLIVGDIGDKALVAKIIANNGIDTIAHFAAHIIVPDSVSNPLDYYHNNTAKARDLIETAVKNGVKHFLFSSTAAVYGEPKVNPVFEDAPLLPINPYGRSKLMVEWILEDVAKAHDFNYAVLRYFNVAGADPLGRHGQSSPVATHLIKIAVQAALGYRNGMSVYGTDYPTADGSCVRDYIHVSDLIDAHMLALEYLCAGGQSLICNCGYERGLSVLEVIRTVKEVSGVDFDVQISDRRPGDPASLIAGAQRVRDLLGWKPQYDNVETIVRHALDWERKLPDIKAQFERENRPVSIAGKK